MAATFENELHELEYEGEFERLDELASHEAHELHEFEDESEGEFELEWELEGEGESEISPVRKIYSDAMMEHLAHLAAESETEQEAAEHFLPLIGLAAKKLLPMVARSVGPKLVRAIPNIARAVTRVEPQLTRGVTRIARGLFRQPGMRSMLHAVPSIARRTISTIARQAAQGANVTPKTALRTLANQARTVLLRPTHRRQAIRRSHWMDNRLHRHMPGAVTPHNRTWYRNQGQPNVPAQPYGPAQTYVQGTGRPMAPGAAWGQVALNGWNGVSHGSGQCNCQAVHCRCCGQVVR